MPGIQINFDFSAESYTHHLLYPLCDMIIFPTNSAMRNFLTQRYNCTYQFWSNVWPKKKPTSIIENFISYINTKSSDYEQVNNELTSVELFSVKGLNFEQIIILEMLYDGIGFLRIYSFELVIKYETLGFKEKWMHPPTTRSLWIIILVHIAILPSSPFGFPLDHLYLWLALPSDFL